MRVPNLHTAPKRHLIKIRTFLRKIDSYRKKENMQDVLKGFLHSKKTPNKFSNDQLKITFKCPNFVRKAF